MEAFDVSAVTTAAVRRAFVEQGLEVPLQGKKPDRDDEHVLDGEGEAHLIALAGSIEKKRAQALAERAMVYAPKVGAVFVLQMEDVLEIYELPYDANRPWSAAMRCPSSF